MASPSVFPGEFGDELLLQIFADIPPEDNLRSLQLVCKKFSRVADDQTIWRCHCRTSFRYWKDESWFRETLAQPDRGEVDWKELWLQRKRTNSNISRIFDSILETKVGRLQKIRDICRHGYDAKDFLLEQLETLDDAEDVLARRYFGMNLLDSLHRGVAIEAWSRLQDAQDPPTVDEAFGAFDMFVVHDQPHDLDAISRQFDDMAARFRTEFDQSPTTAGEHNWERTTTRNKALALARWLRLQGFTGIRNAEDYRNLRNCFIGHVLTDPDHECLPLVSSAIFASLATRLGLDAACCNAPIHVHAVVTSPPGLDLDNNPSADPDRMYLDIYTSASEVQPSSLEARRQLFLANSPMPISTSSFFDPSPLAPLISRMASNINQSYTIIKGLTSDSPQALNMNRLRPGTDPDRNAELAHYASLWATVLSKPITAPDWDVGLDFFLNRFALEYSEDYWIAETYLLPLYESFVSRPQQAVRHRVGWENVREILKMLQNLDARQPAVNRRYTAEIERRVPYRIGQVFRHRRYGYIGIINGWAAAGLASLPTPHYVVEEEEVGPDDEAEEWEGRTARNKGRTYYTCLRPNCERLRLAQETIEIITDPDLIPEQLFFLAGKFFKRFDPETCTFVSNIREFYPDD